MSHSNFVVLKFGGTSVADPTHWRTIADLVRERIAEGMQPVLVCSALAGVTDCLHVLASSSTALAKAELDQALTDLRQRHERLAQSFALDSKQLLAAEWDQLIQLLTDFSYPLTPADRAPIMAMGEILSTRLGVAILERLGVAAHWRDARQALRSVAIPSSSGRHYLNADVMPVYQAEVVVDWSRQKACIVTQGFVARDDQGDTVVLGRGGSDTSAAYLGVVLMARRVEIWTDVPGLFSANPKMVSGARQLRHLSYREAQEIAASGAKVLHPRCLGPLRDAHIPLHIYSTLHPHLPGSVISDEARDFGAQVKAVCCQRGITLISMETVGMWQQVGFLSEAFSIFQRLGLSIDLISTSESNVTVTLDPHAQLLDQQRLDELSAELSAICHVRIETHCASVSLVGRGIRTILHRLGPALELFEERKIHLVSQAANDLNLSFVVDNEYADSLSRQLHHLLIPREARIPEESVFGSLWQSLMQPGEETVALPSWWRSHDAELLKIAGQHESAYVYHLPTVRRQLQRLQQLQSVQRVLYALKANVHPDILRVVRAQGVGFDCVSWAEICYLRELFPDLRAEEVLFTPNFAPRSEYQKALEWGCPVTVDNLYILSEWPDVWRGQRAFVRIDPGQGHGHHQKVKTAGTHSKFGIPVAEAPLVAQRARELDMHINGLHVHIGSGLTLVDNWRRNAELLLQLREHFPLATVLDLGGGLGVPTKAGDSELDLNELDQLLAEVKAAAGQDLALWLEPGRFVVSEAGVLIVHVTQTKGKDHVRYVGVSAGMNALIRPTLYGAYHDIINLSRLHDPCQEIVNVVGPICETGDILGLDRMLAPCHEGDVLLIANAGAYGAVMASRYNLRQTVPEIILDTP